MTINLLDKIQPEKHQELVSEMLNFFKHGLNKPTIYGWNIFIDKNMNDTAIQIISSHERTTIDIIESHIFDLDMTSISKNPNLTFDFIKKYRKELDWYYLSLNSCLTIEIIKSFPEFDNNLYSLSCNPSFNEDIAKYILEKNDPHN